MSALKFLCFALGLSLATAASADQVVGETTDATVGKATGALVGLMVGGAAGGPIGALVGGGLGLLGGGAAQEATGLTERAYTVRTADDQLVAVRSPTETFLVGQEVRQQGNRLHSLD